MVVNMMGFKSPWKLTSDLSVGPVQDEANGRRKTHLDVGSAVDWGP